MGRHGDPGSLYRRYPRRPVVETGLQSLAGAPRAENKGLLSAPAFSRKAGALVHAGSGGFYRRKPPEKCRKESNAPRKKGRRRHGSDKEPEDAPAHSRADFLCRSV